MPSPPPHLAVFATRLATLLPLLAAILPDRCHLCRPQREMSSSRGPQTGLNSRLERRTPQTTKSKSGKNGNVHHSSQHCPPPLQARIHPPAGRHRTHRHTSWQSTRHACLARQAGDTITLDASCFFETRATGTPSPCPCHPHVRSDSPCPASAPLSRRRYDGTQWHKSSERDPVRRRAKDGSLNTLACHPSSIPYIRSDLDSSPTPPIWHGEAPLAAHRVRGRVVRTPRDHLS
jgi:hypothetical protein